MIQDIKPFVYNVTYMPMEPDESSLVCVKHDGKMLVGGDDTTVVLPDRSMLRGIKDELVYLFSIGDLHFFYAVDESEIELDGFSYKPRNVFRNLSPKHIAFAGVTAFQFSERYRNTSFCGRCGSPMRRDQKERMMRCDNCGNTVYPRISPAVIVAVTNGDKLLMTKYAGRGNSPGHALVAGFAEVGETIEETVAREVMEETGIRVKNLKFYKSQPWSFSDTLLFGFFCELDGSEEIHVDESELSVAEWVRREDITVVYNDMSLTNEMICVFKNGPIYD